MVLDYTFVDRRTQLVPKDTAADHLGVLLKAYLSTRTVMAAQDASEVSLMLNAENQELEHAATGRESSDGSLPPRAVAVTLLAYGKETVHCNGARAYLDALAHLASTPLALMTNDPTLGASRIRMTILAGIDAIWFARQVQGQALDSAPRLEDAAVDVCVRWVVLGDTTTIRTEFQTMQCGISTDKSLEAMQNCFLSMKLSYNAPFTDDITTVHSNVPKDAWASSVHNASRAFVELMEGKPCVFKGELLKQHEQEISIESTDVFVRICPRMIRDERGEWIQLSVHDARIRPDAFHAFLVGNAAYLPQIVEYCRNHELLGLPQQDNEHAYMCLHTCGVQAGGFNLANRVSLYATHPQNGGRAPGVPIAPPGSWIWRMEPAVVAIEHVLRDFYVLPCSRDSVMPGDRKLEKPFNDFFNRAYKLYTDTFGLRRQSSLDVEEFERMPLSLPSQPVGSDPAIAAAENYALTAFNLDATTRRIAVGDAYAALRARQAPPQLTNLMLASCVHSGINTSVLDAMGQAAEVLQSLPFGGPAQKAMHDEIGRLKRVADAALDINAKVPRTLCTATAIEACRVKALLSAAGLRKGEDLQLPNGKLTTANYAQLVQTVSACICRVPTDEAAFKQACSAASKCNTLLESLCAVICVLRASGRASIGSAFVVGQDVASNGYVSFNRVLPGGGFERTTPGQIIDSPLSSVLLLRTGGQGMRVTATVRA